MWRHSSKTTRTFVNPTDEFSQPATNVPEIITEVFPTKFLFYPIDKPMNWLNEAVPNAAVTRRHTSLSLLPLTGLWLFYCCTKQISTRYSFEFLSKFSFQKKKLIRSVKPIQNGTNCSKWKWLTWHHTALSQLQQKRVEITWINNWNGAENRSDIAINLFNKVLILFSFEKADYWFFYAENPVVYVKR